MAAVVIDGLVGIDKREEELPWVFGLPPTRGNVDREWRVGRA